ncbi:uncharacterized protein METZ01_LOCUS431104, partial [marine metagenome]
VVKHATNLKKKIIIGNTLEHTMVALHAYNDEMREFSHSRSFESFKSLAKAIGQVSE